MLIKNIKYIICVSVILTLNFSCSKNESNVSVKRIQIKDPIYTKLNLSEIAEKIDYISLEANYNSLIDNINFLNNDVKFERDNIYINNSGQLLRFSSDGRFLNKIGNRGKGPEEYIEADNFSITKNKDQTIVNVFSAAQRKLFQYDEKGVYLKHLYINFWPTGISSSDTKHILINDFGRREESNYSTLSFLDSKGKIKNRLLYRPNEKKINQRNFPIIPWSSIYHFKDTLSYWETNYDTIWRITDDQKIIPRFLFDVGKSKKMPLELQTFEKMKNIKEQAKYSRFQSLIETDRYMFLNSTIGGYLHRITYDKIADDISSVRHEKLSRGYYFAYKNDIDGGFPFWPQGRASDDKVFMFLYGYEIKDFLSKKGKGTQTEPIKDKEASLYLENLAKNSQITDNPILVLVTLKNAQ